MRDTSAIQVTIIWVLSLQVLLGQKICILFAAKTSIYPNMNIEKQTSERTIFDGWEKSSKTFSNMNENKFWGLCECDNISLKIRTPLWNFHAWSFSSILFISPILLFLFMDFEEYKLQNLLFEWVYRIAWEVIMQYYDSCWSSFFMFKNYLLVTEDALQRVAFCCQLYR